MSCQRADELLEEIQSAGPVEIVNATKVRYGAKEAVALARIKAKKVIGLKGEVDLARDKPDDATLAALLLGPTGNLKAPTILVGKTMIVGFNQAAYEKYLT